MALEGLLGRTKNMWSRQLSGSESSQGLEDIRTHRCVKFASWSILPTCEGGTSSGSLLVWNWVIERECSLGSSEETVSDPESGSLPWAQRSRSLW